jgi:hypothetical protein
LRARPKSYEGGFLVPCFLFLVFCLHLVFAFCIPFDIRYSAFGVRYSIRGLILPAKQPDMLIRKLAVPLINDKILLQAEHCYIATSEITEAGFDFIRSRVPPKCKIDLVTGLDGVTSPRVLHKILNHYEGRINLRIFSRNVLHANVYVFELPFRKGVAFTGSGSLTLEGLKDHEEVFWKVSDPKEIESLLSWFTGFFEFGSPLTESIITQYEKIYPELRTQQGMARIKKRAALQLAGFSLETVKFRNQYFKKEHYDVLGADISKTDSAAIDGIRKAVVELAQTISEECGRIGLYQINGIAGGLISGEFAGSLNSVFVAFGRNSSGFNPGLLTFQLGISATHISVRLVVNADEEQLPDRLKLRDRLQEPDVRKNLHQIILNMGSGYYLEMAGNRKPTDYFKQEALLGEFLVQDQEMLLPMFIERVYNPGDTSINGDTISKTILNDLKALKKVAETFLP